MSVICFACQGQQPVARLEGVELSDREARIVLRSSPTTWMLGAA